MSRLVTLMGILVLLVLMATFKDWTTAQAQKFEIDAPISSQKSSLPAFDLATWEAQTLGLQRTQIRNTLPAQLIASQQKKGKKQTLLLRTMEWLFRDNAQEMISPTYYQFLLLKSRPDNLNNGMANSAITAQTTKQTDRSIDNQLNNQALPILQGNVKVNDPIFDGGLKIQNQTASAAVGDNIVIVFNRPGTNNIGLAVSNNRGKSWRETFATSLPNGTNVGDAMVASDTKGNFYVSNAALGTGNLSTIAVTQSKDGGQTWLPGIDAVTTEVKGRNFHDRPWLAIDNSGGSFRDRVYVCWTKFDDIDKRNTIMVSHTMSNGLKFAPSVELTSGTKGFIFSGTRMAIGPGGEVYVCWVNLETQALMMSVSLNGGDSFSAPKTIFQFGGQNPASLLNGSVRINSFASIAVAPAGDKTGRIYLTFNGRPNALAADKSDIFLITSDDQGNSWSQPLRVNSDSTITDQFMPSVTITPKGRVAISWYDRRNDPINNGLTDVYMAISQNGGDSFAENLRVTDTSWLFTPTLASLPFGYQGEYNQISTQGEDINLQWGDDRNGQDADIYFQSISADTIVFDDFSLSGRTIATELRAGESGKVICESVRIRAFNDPINLRATTDLPNAILQLSDSQILAGNGFDLTVTVPADAKPGNYLLQITGQSKDRSRATNGRIVVLNSRPGSKPANLITHTAGNSQNPQIAIDNSNVVHMVWQDDSSGPAQIFYASSSDGQNFTPAINISRSFGAAMRPIIGVDNSGNIHALWEEHVGNFSFIVYTRSQDGGNTFSSKRVISAPSEIAFDSRIFVESSGAIDLVWPGRDKLTDTTNRLYLVRSLDGGETFSLPQTIDASSDRVFYEPSVAIDSKGNIHIAYAFMVVTSQRFNSQTFTAALFYIRSTDQGKTFSEPINIIPNNFNLADSPKLMVDSNGGLGIFFAGFNNKLPFPSREIYYARSFDNGISFIVPLDSISRGNGDSTAIGAAFSPNGVLNVVWRDTQGGNYDIFLSRLFPGEQTFFNPTNISQNLAISENPAVAVDRLGNIIIGWGEETVGNNEIATLKITTNDLPPMKVTGFSPAQAAIGEQVTINGENFQDLVDVKIGSLSAKFNLISATQLNITVPNGAVSGQIFVGGLTGLARSNNLFFISGKVGANISQLNFSSIAVGTSATQKITLINSGNEPRKVMRIDINNNAFSTNITLPMTLAGGATVDIPVTFKPTTNGLQQARMSVTSEDPSPISIPVPIDLFGNGLDSKAPVIKVMSPNGGELIRPGNNIKISWQADDDSALATQMIELSLDGGQTFSTVIAEGLIGTREFNWSVPMLETKQARIRIVGIDVAGNRGEAVSASDFRITKKKK